MHALKIITVNASCLWFNVCVCVVSLQEFPDKQELHRNMLGLLGNVAEVKELRPQLLTSQFITVFRCSISTPPSSLFEHLHFIYHFCAFVPPPVF